MTSTTKSIGLGLLFAVSATVSGLTYLLPSNGNLSTVLPWVGSFACFGFFVGGIFAFDPTSEIKIKSSFVGRVGFGAVSALLLSAIWRWPVEGAILAILLGAILGYFGLLWAKHVDF